MKEYNENSLTDELVNRFDLDVGDIDSYFKFYDKDAIINRLNSGKLNIEQLYDGMAQWLGIANIFESNIDENTTFTQYLNESGFTLKQYTEDVYNACLSVDESKYRNIDLYYSEDIEKAFNDKVPVNTIAADIMSKFDTEFTVPKSEEDDEGFTPENGYEDFEKEYGKTLHQLTDENENDEEMVFVDEYDFSNDFNESTTQDDLITDGADYNEWKLNAFKYIDKRVDVNKIKELGKYIKSFLKQEYDNGEPSWFMAAESVVNYVRINYSNCLKDRSYVTSITESTEEKDVLVITFENEETANEEEYQFANEGGWDSQFDIGRKDNKIYVEYTDLSEKVTKEWYGDKVQLEKIPVETYNEIFYTTDVYESVETKPIREPAKGAIEFYTEDQAMDAFDAWNKMQNPSLRVGDWLNPLKRRQMEEYHTYKTVTVTRDNMTLYVSAPRPKLLRDSLDWLSEFDEDSVKQIIKFKKQNKK